jgi:hypothetical protein
MIAKSWRAIGNNRKECGGTGETGIPLTSTTMGLDRVYIVLHRMHFGYVEMIVDPEFSKNGLVGMKSVKSSLQCI